MTRGKRATINDIARETGYSKSTISFAFNNPQRIGVDTRKKILEVADQLGYIPDPMARNFSLQRQRSIGFLLPQKTEFSIRNPYVYEILVGISQVCQDASFTLTLIPPLNESLSAAVRNAPVDGFIALGMKVDMEIVDVMQKRQIPYVTIDGVPSADMPSVNIDDETAAYSMMKEVLGFGHRRIAILSLCRDAYYSENADGVVSRRLRGYSRALAEVGMSLQSEGIMMLESECNIDEGLKAADRILDSGFCPTAVVAMADILAIACIRRFSAKGIRIPHDVSVVGFDDIGEAAYSNPPLTTVSQPGAEKGRLAASALLGMINGKEAENSRIVSQFEVVMRDSLGRPESGK
ncbi:MAG: LacI family DNA-binding transcriptional regulator [Sphaerochaetaceae bacterium]|jgi:DNA-binding LacI/PurR family transcriptional regulator|nr:LacI family DNA-binding transcriptional regulator [Sphaerochaetaceae bacterium]MDD3162614.1 LacI family DNA-binding transcriptional regulator [Sphaerochaetaceae bacterium]MDD4007242.1 LacI family DNA-binding transcriptional regulator [Sphaerochaetaceae bacterium]MDD4396113.1 LacI family DNA-binding transcriptional regulator [Sphaerochaetaceae bacterium]